MFLFKILFNQVFNILFFERIYTIMNTIYLFSIIILIFLIMIFKSIQYYYFLKDKQNLYVLIKKKYMRFGIVLILLTILNLLSIFIQNKIQPVFISLLLIEIFAKNLLTVLDLIKKNFLVLNLEQKVLRKKIFLYKIPSMYFLLILIEYTFIIYISPNIITITNIILFILVLYFLITNKKQKPNR